MATHKDALKRARQAEAARLRNRTYKTKVKSAVKAVRDAVAAGKVEPAQAALREAMSTLHKVASKGVIHKNNAARRISRLNAAVKKLALAGK
jgi:small subunit ribosomal protein S20